MILVRKLTSSSLINSDEKIELHKITLNKFLSVNFPFKQKKNSQEGFGNPFNEGDKKCLRNFSQKICIDDFTTKNKIRKDSDKNSRNYHEHHDNSKSKLSNEFPNENRSEIKGSRKSHILNEIGRSLRITEYIDHGLLIFD